MVEIGLRLPLATFSDWIPCRGHSARKSTLFGHRCTLVWPPPVRLFAQPTNVRGVGESPLTIIYSDEHKGLKASIEKEASAVIHRLCIKHLASNFPGPGIGEVCSA